MYTGVIARSDSNNSSILRQTGATPADENTTRPSEAQEINQQYWAEPDVRGPTLSKPPTYTPSECI